MPDSPQSLALDLDEGKTRFRFPTRPIFLCGGVIREDDGRTSPSLRDYLVRIRKVERRLPDKLILAERANQLFLKTDYKSLIRFEEDIALLSGLIVLIAESPGALAELGSFEANQTIRSQLRVIIQDRFENDRSFIRNGPIEQLISDNNNTVAFYPWKTTSTGSLIKSTAKDDVSSITEYISEQHDAIAKTQLLSSVNARKKSLFYLYWIVHLCGGQSPTAIYEIFKSIFPGARDTDLRNGLYCIELLGWVGRIRYGTKEYFFALHDDDPLAYRFKHDVVKTNATARKQQAYEWVHDNFLIDHRARRRITKSRREMLK